jgi:hypothetical protein
MKRTCSAVITAIVLGIVSIAGAQTNGHTNADERAMLRTISGYLERTDDGAYFLRDVEWTIAFGRTQRGINGAVETSGASVVSPVAVSTLQIVGLLPPGAHRYAHDGSSLRPFVGHRVELTGIPHARYGTDERPALELLDWSRREWLPQGVTSVRALDQQFGV